MLFNLPVMLGSLQFQHALVLYLLEVGNMLVEEDWFHLGLDNLECERVVSLIKASVH